MLRPGLGLELAINPLLSAPGIPRDVEPERAKSAIVSRTSMIATVAVTFFPWRIVSTMGSSLFSSFAYAFQETS